MLSLEVEKTEYFPGELVRGRVLYTPNKEQTVTGVYIRFKGYEHSEWQEGDVAVTQAPNSETVMVTQLLHHGKRKHIFKFVKTLWGNEWGKANPKKMKLKLQSWQWPFVFELPRNIPPSVEYKKGKLRIEYQLKAHVKIPGNNSMKIRKNLIVGSILQPLAIQWKDFELQQSSKLDRLLSLNKDSRFFLKVSTKKQFTWPEDKFILRLRIDNRTNRSFNAVIIWLQQYWSSGKTTEKQKIAKWKLTEGFPLEKSKQFDGLVEIPMPQKFRLLPTTRGSLIQLNYHLILEFQLSSLIKNPKLHIPLVVSSVPIIGEVIAQSEFSDQENEAKLRIYHAQPLDSDISFTTHEVISQTSMNTTVTTISPASTIVTESYSEASFVSPAPPSYLQPPVTVEPPATSLPTPQLSSMHLSSSTSTTTTKYPSSSPLSPDMGYMQPLDQPQSQPTVLSSAQSSHVNTVSHYGNQASLQSSQSYSSQTPDLFNSNSPLTQPPSQPQPQTQPQLHSQLSNVKYTNPFLQPQSQPQQSHSLSQSQPLPVNYTNPPQPQPQLQLQTQLQTQTQTQTQTYFPLQSASSPSAVNFNNPSIPQQSQPLSQPQFQSSPVVNYSIQPPPSQPQSQSLSQPQFQSSPVVNYSIQPPPSQPQSQSLSQPQFQSSPVVNYSIQPPPSQPQSQSLSQPQFQSSPVVNYSIQPPPSQPQSLGSYPNYSTQSQTQTNFLHSTSPPFEKPILLASGKILRPRTTRQPQPQPPPSTTTSSHSYLLTNPTTAQTSSGYQMSYHMQSLSLNDSGPPPPVPTRPHRTVSSPPLQSNLLPTPTHNVSSDLGIAPPETYQYYIQKMQEKQN